MSWTHDAVGAAACAGEAGMRALADERTRSFVTHMLERDLNCPPSSGMGRLFDAAAALLGVCDYNHHEAMSGMLLEAEAAKRTLPETTSSRSPMTVRCSSWITGRWVPRVCWRGSKAVSRCRRSPGSFTMRSPMLSPCAACVVSGRTGLTTVGLTGGVFCNTLLTELVSGRLESAELEVLVHRVVPPNDGGLAYGQAAVAGAVLG